MNINDVPESATIFPRPCKLTFDRWTLKAVSESRVTCATRLPILVFLGLSVLDLPELRNRQTSDRQTSDVRQHRRLMSPPWGRGHNNPGRVRPGRSDYVGQNMCDSVPTADECNSYVRVSAVFMRIGYTVRPDASWL